MYRLNITSEDLNTMYGKGYGKAHWDFSLRAFKHSLLKKNSSQLKDSSQPTESSGLLLQLITDPIALRCHRFDSELLLKAQPYLNDDQFKTLITNFTISFDPAGAKVIRAQAAHHTGDSQRAKQLLTEAIAELGNAKRQRRRKQGWQQLLQTFDQPAEAPNKKPNKTPNKQQTRQPIQF